MQNCAKIKNVLVWVDIVIIYKQVYIVLDTFYYMILKEQFIMHLDRVSYIVIGWP